MWNSLQELVLDHVGPEGGARQPDLAARGPSLTEPPCQPVSCILYRLSAGRKTRQTDSILGAYSLFVVCIHQVVPLGIVNDDPSDLTALKGAPLPRRREATRVQSTLYLGDHLQTLKQGLSLALALLLFS